MQKLIVCRGVEMPFYPMRPWSGKALRNLPGAELVYNESLDNTKWIIQPKLNGDRACLAVKNGHVYIQSRHGDWYRKRVHNAADFKALPDGTVLDGEVFKGNFSAFETLAYEGKSLMFRTCLERCKMAEALTGILKHDWLFASPSREWLNRLKSNAPDYDGVVLKMPGCRYLILSSAHAFNQEWQKRTWN